MKVEEKLIEKLVVTVKLTIYDPQTHLAMDRLKDTNKMSAYVCAALFDFVRSEEGKKQLEVMSPKKILRLSNLL